MPATLPGPPPARPWFVSVGRRPVLEPGDQPQHLAQRQPDVSMDRMRSPAALDVHPSASYQTATESRILEEVFQP